MSSKKIIIILAIIIAAATGGYFLFIFLTLTKPTAVKQAAENGIEQKLATVTPQIIRSAPDRLPESFPENLPLYGKEKIIDSYNASYQVPGKNQAAKQASVVFKSSKSMKENYDYYANWAKENGWNIVNKADNEMLKFVYLRKNNNEDINITITKDKVSISYTKF